MRNEELINQIAAVFKEQLNTAGFELIELTFRFENGRNVLRMLADRPMGRISLGECARLNRELGQLLEERGLIPEGYVLEINSPGLDRPLRTEGDFARNKGNEIKVFLTEPINGRIEVDGTVSEVSPEGVALLTGDGCVSLPLAKINKAKLILK